jgi:hypothetical protein
VRIEFVLQNILPANQNLQGGERRILFQIDIFSKVDEIYECLGKKPPVLDAAESQTLFLSEISVRFGREYFLQIIVFKVEKGSFCCKQAYSAKLKKHMHISKQNRV